MASYSVTCDHRSVTFIVNGISAGNVIRTVLRLASDTYLLYNVDFKAISTSLSVTIPDDLESIYAVNGQNTYYDNGCVAFDLTPETDYACRVYVFPDTAAADAERDCDILDKQDFRTSAKPAVEEWSWESSNGPEYLATTAQTEQAYTAITNNGYLSDFSYLVWNDLVYKTNEVITGRNGSWNTTYGTLSQTLMTSSDRVMTAKRFNAVWWNLAQYVTVGLSRARVAGETVMGSYFVTLAEAVNRAIWRG